MPESKTSDIVRACDDTRNTRRAQASEIQEQTARLIEATRARLWQSRDLLKRTKPNKD